MKLSFNRFRLILTTLFLQLLFVGNVLADWHGHSEWLTCKMDNECVLTEALCGGDYAINKKNTWMQKREPKRIAALHRRNRFQRQPVVLKINASWFQNRLSSPDQVCVYAAYARQAVPNSSNKAPRSLPCANRRPPLSQPFEPESGSFHTSLICLDLCTSIFVKISRKNSFWRSGSDLMRRSKISFIRSLNWPGLIK